MYIHFVYSKVLERLILIVGAMGNYSIGDVEERNIVEKYSIVPDYRRIQNKINLKTIRVAVLVHLFYEEQVEYIQKYLKEVPDGIDIVILSSKEEILKQFQNDRYIKIKKENRGRDISALLVAAKKIIFQYKYICFVHDKKEKNPDDKEYVDLWKKNMWDNMLQSAAYVYNILDVFENDEGLGMLVPLPPHKGDKGVWLKRGWGNTYEQIRDLAKELGILSYVCYENPPFTYSTVFWVKMLSLRKLFLKEWKYTDFPDEPMRDYGEINHAVERILQYIVEDAGYETRIVLSSTFASGFIEQLKVEMNKIWDWNESTFGISNYNEMDYYRLRLEKVKQFEKSHSNIYLYGAGKAGRDCLKMCSMLDIKPVGVLVTDIADAPADMEGIQVLPIAESSVIKGSGIIITVYNNSYQDEIKRVLEKEGFYDYIVF